MASDAKARLECSEADRLADQLLERGGEPPEELADHVARCERCRGLYNWVLGPEMPDEMPNGVSERISAEVKRSLEPVKPLPSTGRLTARFVGIFGFLAAVMVAFFGPGGAQRMSVVQLAGVAVLLLAAAGLLAVFLSWQMVPGSRQRIPLSWLVSAFAAGFSTVVAVLFPWERLPEILRAGWVCTYHGAVIALPVGVVTLGLALRGAPLSYRVLGATVGAVAGLLSLTVLQFTCENQHAGHLLIWHGGVLALSLAAGYLCGWAAEQITLRARRR